MSFLRVAMTPAGVPAVYTPRLADFEGLGQEETESSWVDMLPGLIKTGGDVAANLYRAVNYNPAVYPTTYQSAGMLGGGAGGISPLLLLGGAAVLLFAFSGSGKKR